MASSIGGTDVDLEIRPSHKPGWLRAMPKVLVTSIGLLAPGLVLFWLQRPAIAGGATIVGLASFACVAVLVVSVLWLYQRNARIFVRGTQIGQVDMWGRSHLWSVDSIKEAVSGSVNMSARGKSLIPNVHVVLLIDRNGAAMMSLSPSLWDPSDLEHLWQRLGVEAVEGWTEPLLPEDLRRKYPGAVHEIPSSSMAPVKGAVVIVGSLVLAIVLAICLPR